MRLQKYMAQCGVASRRACETLIKAGQVKINGTVVTEMGVLVDEGRDVVTVNGKRLSAQQHPAYFMLYKPRGVVCTMKDENGRKCIADFFRHQKRRLYPVGRLDLESEGLLLITDDGAFAQKVMHPSFGVEKEYRATLDKPYQAALTAQLLSGIDIGEGEMAQAKSLTHHTRQDGRGVVNLVLAEGKNREVRRMFEAQGFEVLRLKRTRVGMIELGDLRPGESKRLTQAQALEAFSVPKVR